MIVKVWDCRDNTDKPHKIIEFDTWDEATKYLKKLEPWENGIITRSSNAQ